MFKLFEAPTADLVFQQIRSEFVKGAFYVGQDSRNGKTSEILHSALTIRNPRKRWVVSRRPALNIAFALAEVIWIVRGRNDSMFLNYFNRELPKYAGTGLTYHGAYGHRLRTTFGLDQLDRAYMTLKHNPDSRQVVLQMWNPKSDFPDPAGRPVSEDIPCNIVSLLKIREGKLEWLQVMRSNDLYRGLPYNVIQFTMLHEIMSGWLGVGLGQYHHMSDSLHIYQDTEQSILDSTPVESTASNDELSMLKPESDSTFKLLEEIVEKLICENIPVEHIITLATKANLAAGYINIAVVLCAESARRRGQLQLARDLIAGCTNPEFKSLYGSWLIRMSAGCKHS